MRKRRSEEGLGVNLEDLRKERAREGRDRVSRSAVSRRLRVWMLKLCGTVVAEHARRLFGAWSYRLGNGVGVLDGLRVFVVDAVLWGVAKQRL